VNLEGARVALKSFADTAKEILMSDGEFADGLGATLKGYSDCGLDVEAIVSHSGTEIARYPRVPPSSALETYSSTNPAGRVTVKVLGRNRELAEDEGLQAKRQAITLAEAMIVDLIHNHWGTRNDMTLLPYVQEINNRDRLKETIATWRRAGVSLVVAHIDLDNFKLVNNLSHDTGDEVLKEVGGRFREDFGDSAIVIRYGGEEFVVVFHDCDFRLAMRSMERFRERMATEAFAAIGRPNSCSIGIVLSPSSLPGVQTENDFTDRLVAKAEAANRLAKEEGRNCIRVASDDIQPKPDGALTSSALIQSALLSRQGICPGDEPPFGNELHKFGAVWLAERLNKATLRDVEDGLSELVMKFGFHLHCSPKSIWSDSGTAPFVHIVELASIVLHALLSNALVGRGPLDPRDRITLRASHWQGEKEPSLGIEVERTGLSLFRIRVGDLPSDQPELSCYSGRPWRSRELAETTAVQRLVVPDGPPNRLSPCLLVSIGQESANLGLTRWAADSVQIDDRPVTGGGLPDFWQSNASRVVRTVLGNVNINAVLFIGDKRQAARTESVLMELRDPKTQARLGRRLSLDADALEIFRAREPTIHWSDASEAAALKQLNDIYFGAEEKLTLVGEPLILAREQKQHRLKMPAPHEGHGLRPIDGLRCRSLGDAYPRAIWLLRDAEGPRNSDHMGRPFKEVRGFKLVLELPFEDPVPDYWIDEKLELDSYFDRQFISEAGLFGSRFLQWGSKQGTPHNQVQSAIDDIVTAMCEGIATRRVILFIAEPSDDWKTPLGLVACHVLPRKREDARWYLEFQWVWRTVEALVGLPFSCYGSIRFSEKILENVNTARVANDQPRALMGDLTYIALSLHLFLDEGDTEIARAVVTSAIV